MLIGIGTLHSRIDELSGKALHAYVVLIVFLPRTPRDPVPCDETLRDALGDAALISVTPALTFPVLSGPHALGDAALILVTPALTCPVLSGPHALGDAALISVTPPDLPRSLRSPRTR